MTGAQILVDALKREGVDLIFGYPGGSVISAFDALDREAGMRVILTRHEQGAAHAADGYARATGRVGVCLVTSGPGATNTITGIAAAKLDSIPLVVISGQVSTRALGSDAFQETDVSGLTRPICKHSYLARRVEDLAQIIKEAFFIARSGRPGPVAVDLPVDVAAASMADYRYPETVDLPGYRPKLKGNPRQLDRLADALRQARRPLLYAGGGVINSEAGDALLAFMEQTRIPLVETLMGLGGVPSDHPLFLGMPGMHGRVAANQALSGCDLLIGLGTRFDDRVAGHTESFAAKAIKAHVDIDPAEIGKTVSVDIPIVGDVKTVLADLSARVPEPRWEDWIQTTARWKVEHPLSYSPSRNGDIPPQYVIERIQKNTRRPALIVTDVGQHQMWSAHYCRSEGPRSFITSGGLGVMGFGLPAAMGAALGRPDRMVVNISGDGGIQMNMQELTTCALNRIPVKIVVLNNHFLGMVRQWQDLFWERRYANTCLKQTPDCPVGCAGPGPECSNIYRPDLVSIAEACGVPGVRVEDPAQVDSVLEQGFRSEGPILMEFRVRPTENVFPMVPAGKPLTQSLKGESS